MDVFGLISSLAPNAKINDYVVYRFGPGSYSGATYVSGMQTNLVIHMSVQPANDRERLLLEEGDRLKGAIKSYSEQEIRAMDDITLAKADQIIFNNRPYEVKKVNNYIDYYESLAVLLNEDSI